MDARQAKKHVKRFFEILDKREYNQSGMGDELWAPTYVRIDENLKVDIPSCRALYIVELDKLLRELKEWSNGL
jgi:hypothetical protein